MYGVYNDIVSCNRQEERVIMWISVPVGFGVRVGSRTNSPGCTALGGVVLALTVGVWSLKLLIPFWTILLPLGLIGWWLSRTVRVHAYLREHAATTTWSRAALWALVPKYWVWRQVQKTGRAVAPTAAPAPHDSDDEIGRAHV